jgi:hypothetical protein
MLPARTLVVPLMFSVRTDPVNTETSVSPSGTSIRNVEFLKARMEASGVSNWRVLRLRGRFSTYTSPCARWNW